MRVYLIKQKKKQDIEDKNDTQKEKDYSENENDLGSSAFEQPNTTTESMIDNSSNDISQSEIDRSNTTVSEIENKNDDNSNEENKSTVYSDNEITENDVVHTTPGNILFTDVPPLHEDTSTLKNEPLLSLSSSDNDDDDKSLNEKIKFQKIIMMLVLVNLWKIHLEKIILRQYLHL